MANNTLGGTINSLRQQPWLQDPLAGDAEEPWAQDPIVESDPVNESPEFTVGQTNAESAAVEAPWQNDPVVGGQGPGPGTFRAEGYGPNAGDPRTHATTYGPLGRLRDDDIAVSPNMLDRFPLRSKVDIVDPKTGQVVYANHRVADYSYIDSQHPNHDVFEQRHVQDMGHMILRPSATPWANDPVVGGAESTAAAPWANDPIVKANEQQQPPTEQPQAQAKPEEANQWDIGKAWQNLFSAGSESSATLDAHAALDDLNRAKSGIGRGGVFEPIRKAQDDELLANPNTPKEDKDRIISMRDNQILAEQDAAQKQYDQKTKEAAATAAAAPGPEYQKTIPGIVTRFVGQQAPFLLSGGLGPLAPALLGIQMSEASYGDNFDSNKQKLKTLNPGWSDGQIDAVADKTAREASQTSFETGVVAGLLPVPKVGPLVQRMVQMMGFRGAYMVVAGAAQDIQDNLATKKYVDPKQAIYDGILAHMPANFAMGAAFEAVPALGEIGRGDRSIVRVAPSGEEIAPSNKAPAEEGPLPVGEQPKPTFPGYVVPPAQTPQEGDKAAPVEENGEGVTVEPNEDQEAGRTTEPTTQATPGNGQAEPGGVSPLAQAPEAEEAKRPWSQLAQPERQQVTDRVRRVLDAAINRYRPLFNALGVPIVERGEGIALTPADWGTPQAGPNTGSVMNYNFSDYAEGLYRDWTDGGTHYADQRLTNDTVEHELIHAAWIDAQHRRWLASDRSKSWLAFHYDQAAKIDESLQDAIRDARAKGNNELADVLEKGVNAGIGLYTYGNEAQRMSPGMRAAEIVRQLVQMKTRNQITEDFNQGVFGNLLSHIQNFYETARARLGELWNRVRGGAAGTEELRQAVDETSQRLAEIGYLRETGEPAERYGAPERPEEYTPGKESYRGPRQLSEKMVLPNRDVAANQPHTEDLIRAVDEWRGGEGNLLGRAAQLMHFFKVLKRANPGLSKEIDQIGRYAEDNGVLPPQMSPEARSWLNVANNGLFRELGDRMRAGNFKVLMPDGSTRNFIGAPKGVMPFPRVMRPDVANLLGGRLLKRSVSGRALTRDDLMPAAQKLYDEGVNAVNKNTGKSYFQKPEDLLEWANKYSIDHRERPNMTNLEMARTTKYPSFFYTYSPEAMLDRLFKQSSELTRLESFGQKLPGMKDLFDQTVDKISGDRSLSGSQIRHALKAIEELRSTVYGSRRRSWELRLFKSLSSAGLAGSIHTSFKIAVSMLSTIPAYRGLGNTLSGIYDHAFHHGDVIAEARRLGLLQEHGINLSDDPYAITSAEKRAQNIFTGTLRLAGHAFVQDTGKAVTARVSRLWLEGAIKKLQADPTLHSSLAKQVAEDIGRRGLDWRDFAQAKVSQELKDRFVREDVNDLQTAYRPEDYPAWMSQHPLMAQFGHWAYNGARAIMRDSIIPMVRATGRGDFMLAGRYMTRLAGISLAAMGAAEVWRELDQLFGRQANVATIGEIMKAFTRNSPEAAHMLTARMTEDILTTPVTGLFGDVTNIVRNVTKGTAGETHFFNPTSPAAVGYVAIIARAINQASQQGGHLSKRQWSDFANQLAGLVKGYADVANTAGIPIPGHAEAMGRRDVSFVKSRLDLFYEMHPEFDKRQKGGTYAGNAHTPYLQDINEALVSGNVAEARRIAQALRRDQGLTQKQLETTLRESLGAHRPIPTGTGGDAFIRWAQRSLTPDELARVRHIERVYESTAQRAGLPVKPEEESGSTPLASAINSLRGP